jgi:Fe-S-cluster containining protein
MKRACPYCGLRLKGKKLSTHISKEHQGAGKKFFCREDCVRCCTDLGAPLELVLEDILRIAGELKISSEDFLKIYGGVLWTNIPGTKALIPSTGLPFPCKFLKTGKCSIYEFRPLHCRLFPERLFINPAPDQFEPFYKSGYTCVDEGFYMGEEREEEIERLMDIDRSELERTANFFKNERLIYELSQEQYKIVQKMFGETDQSDPERNRKRRKILEDFSQC